jgi:RNA polymerase sigma-70 factor, ECF subfamily
VEVPALDIVVPAPAETSIARQTGLLSRVAHGDARAMEECIAAYGGLVWNIVFKRVRDRSEAEDLTQEIFTEVWRSAGRHDPRIASESGFIAMIARRRSIDWCRRRQHLPEMESLPAGGEIAGQEVEPEGPLDGEALWKALEALPDETRRLFELHFREGMTHQEISEQTGQPLGSVKTRLRRGLIEAKRLLAMAGGAFRMEVLP